MAKVLVSESNLTNIANAIRTKNGSSNAYTPAQMATAIGDIQTGITPTGSKSIEENGTHDVTNYASAVVDVKNISASYQTSTPNQTVDFSFPNRSWAEDGEIRLNFTRPRITLSPDEGYVAGHIVINGVDTGSSSFAGQDIHEGDVITFTDAVSLYNLNTTITLGADSLAAGTLYYYYGYQSNNYGSVGDDEFWYYNSGQKNYGHIGKLVFDMTLYHSDRWVTLLIGGDVNNLGCDATVYIGDSSTSNYWSGNAENFSTENYVDFQGNDAQTLYNYVVDCYANQTPIPIKIQLSNNPS